MRLHWKLMLIYTSVVVIVMASVHVYLDRALRGFLVSQLVETLTKEGRLAASYLLAKMSDGSIESGDALANHVARQLEVRATIIDGKGTVRGDSKVPSANLENQADRPEIMQALNGQVGRSLRYSETLEQEVLYVAIPVSGAGEGKIVLRLAMPINTVGQVQNRISRVIWVGSGLGLSLALLLSYTISRFVSRPIGDLTKVARSVAAGDFGDFAKVSRPLSFELRELAEALHSMRRQIRERIGQISVEKSRLEAILGSIAEGILVADHSGYVLMTNQAFDRLFSVTPHTEGRLPAELVQNSNIEDTIKETLAGTRVVTKSMTVPGVPERHFDVHVAPILQNEAVIGVVAIFYDITEITQLERIRKDFVANVSHELRTPLTAIRGCADTLAEGALTDPEAATRFVQTIVSNAERLQLLLEDLLDLSRLESGKLSLELELCKFYQILQHGVESVGHAAEKKGISISLDIPTVLKVRCDRKLIEQAVINLLDNAIKYTPEDGNIRISILLNEDETQIGKGSMSYSPGLEDRLEADLDGVEEPVNKVAVEVTDTGIGIPLEDLPRVFERFYRVDKARSRQMGGTGLGLSIVRHIVEAHGERVYVKSELGVGSTFGFTLPVP